MTALLNPKVWLAVALAAALAFALHFTYKSGKATVRAAWDAERLEQSEAARRDEKARTIANQGVDHAYQIKERARVAAAVVTAGRLRDLETALADASADSPATSGVDAPFASIARECAGKLVLLDGHAQILAATAGALQSYAREVCVAQNPD